LIAITGHDLVGPILDEFPPNREGSAMSSDLGVHISEIVGLGGRNAGLME
jgi:hypothetical protein